MSVIGFCDSHLPFYWNLKTTDWSHKSCKCNSMSSSLEFEKLKTASTSAEK